MDDSRLDKLARALSEAHSRRGLTRLLSGLAVGGPLAALGVADSEGKPKKKKKGKKKRSRGSSPVPPPPTPPTGCTGSCAGKACGADNGCGTPCQTGSCPTGETCQSGQCVSSGCPAGTRDCGGGVCQECCFGQTNSDYHCCPPEYPNCHDSTVYFGINRSCTEGGICRCPETYPAECTISGASGTCHQCCPGEGACLDNEPEGAECYYGRCVCPAGETSCHTWGGGPRYCTDLTTDEDHCGDCTIRCSTSFTCQNGRCVFTG